MSSRVRARATSSTGWPVVLRSGDGRARVRPWWHDPTIAQVTFIDRGVVPSSTVMQVWVSELKARGFAGMRTGAVTEAGADLLERLGFETIQRLRLLDLSLVSWRPPRNASVRTRRLRGRERSAAAAVDEAAFGSLWAMDEYGIDETCDATPVHRARTVEIRNLDEARPDTLEAGDTAEAPLAGYAISGRADKTGYLQRLAVHPRVQGLGIGLALANDSLVWMRRHHLTRAIVNTHTDNVVALGLYDRLGFRVLPQQLNVLTRRFDDA